MLTVAHRCERLLVELSTEDARQWVLAYLAAAVLSQGARQHLLNYLQATVNAAAITQPGPPAEAERSIP